MLADLQWAGKIATVQNRYNLMDRQSEQLLNFCSDEGSGFIPWTSIAAGGLRKSHSGLAELAQQSGATPNQLAVAWLLRRSPVILLIPGTSIVVHLEENLIAASIHLSDAQFEALTNKIHC